MVGNDNPGPPNYIKGKEFEQLLQLKVAIFDKEKTEPIAEKKGYWIWIYIPKIQNPYLQDMIDWVGDAGGFDNQPGEFTKERIEKLKKESLEGSE